MHLVECVRTVVSRYGQNVAADALTKGKTSNLSRSLTSTLAGIVQVTVANLNVDMSLYATAAKEDPANDNTSLSLVLQDASRSTRLYAEVMLAFAGLPRCKQKDPDSQTRSTLVVEAAVAVRPLTRAEFRHGLTLLGVRMGFWQWGNLWRIFNVAGCVSSRRWYEVISGKSSNGDTGSVLESRSPKPLRKPKSLIQRLNNEITKHRLESFKSVIDDLNAACKCKRQYLFAIASEVRSFLQKDVQKSDGAASSRSLVRAKRLAKAAMSTVVANQVDFFSSHDPASNGRYGIGAESLKVRNPILSSNQRSHRATMEYKQTTLPCKPGHTTQLRTHYSVAPGRVLITIS